MPEHECKPSCHNPCLLKEEKRPTRHKIGCARTIKTAVLVVEYLRQRCADPHSKINKDSIRYVFTEASATNGWWSADIIVDSWDSLRDSGAISRMADTCRAFVAGAGEVWA